MSSQILCCASERSFNIRNPTKFGSKGLNGSRLAKAAEIMTVARGMGSQGMPSTGGGGLARVPNLRVCKHLLVSGGTRRGGRMN